MILVLNPPIFIMNQGYNMNSQDKYVWRDLRGHLWGPRRRNDDQHGIMPRRPTIPSHGMAWCVVPKPQCQTMPCHANLWCAYAPTPEKKKASLSHANLCHAYTTTIPIKFHAKVCHAYSQPCLCHDAQTCQGVACQCPDARESLSKPCQGVSRLCHNNAYQCHAKVCHAYATMSNHA